MGGRATVVAVALVLAACGGGDDDAVDLDASRETVTLTFGIDESVNDAGRDQLTEIVEERLHALGVRDPSVQIDGDRLVVEVDRADVGPRVDDLELIAAQPELRFRPVLLAVPLTAELPPELVVAPREEDVATETVVLEEPDAYRYRLGPAALTGEIVEDADAVLSAGDDTWGVSLVLTSDGIDAFNRLAASCFPPSPTCPTGQLAIVLDGEVQSAPTIQTASFERDEIVISGSFTEEEAKDVALVLRFGRLPVRLELIDRSE